MLTMCTTGYAEESKSIELFVSVNGNNDGNGSISSPFLTIQRAQEAVRELNGNMSSDITVYIRGGVYEQAKPLLFTEKDSGTNGYNVIWKAYNNETVEISGGSRVTGWKKYNDKLWAAPYDKTPYVRQLWVNGKKAVRAQSEKLYDIADFFKDTDSKYLYDGLVTKETKFSDYRNQQDIQLHFARGWKSFLLNVEKIEAGSDGRAKWYMYQPAFTEAEKDSMNHNIDVNHNFFVENAFEELDREGEFYFDRTEKQLYYMPKADEDMLSADVVAPVIESLIEIKGKNANERVKNIIFENLSFAHVTWFRPSYVGLVNDQAQDTHPDESYDIKREPGFTFVPAGIQLDRAEKIQFIGNRIFDFGQVGIGLYQGAINCKFIGNTFYDIADSAMTIGTDDQAYEDKIYEGYNLAVDKVTSASSYDPLYSPLKAIDCNGSTGWSPNGTAPHWWQVDLEEAYQIDRVEIDARLGYDQSMTRNNFEVLGSNDAEFNEYEVLTACGAEGFAHEGTGVFSVTSNNKYRYIRLQKTNTDYFYLADVRIINESMQYSPTTESCKNVQIQNNYITRIGQTNYGAPGIQAYYISGLNVSNNEIYDVPYSGICTGWGWTNYRDSVVCRNNTIAFNRLNKVMQMCFDGGAIYTLGHQPNSKIVGNYISNQPNNLAAIYLDAGSTFQSITDNVIENVPVAFFSAAVSSDNLWRNNFVTSSKTEYLSNVNAFAEELNVFIPDNYSYEALTVMKNAGLKGKWKTLPDTVCENEWDYPHEIKVNNAKKEIVYGLMHDEKFKNYYLQDFLQSGRVWLENMEAGEGLWEYPEEAVAEFKSMIEDMFKVAQKVPQDRDEIISKKEEFLLKTEELSESRKRPSVEEIKNMAQELLQTVSVGSQIGMVSQADYNTLKNLYDTVNTDSCEHIDVLLLESYIKEFDLRKVNLDIFDFKLNGQLGSAVIDNDNATIIATIKHSVNYDELKPEITVHEKAFVENINNKFTDGKAEFTVMSHDKVAQKKWTVTVLKPDTWSSEEALDLKEIVSDTDNWYKFGAYNYSNYSKKIFGDGTLNFRLNIEKRENDWPSLIFRSQEYDSSFQDIGNSAYVVVFAQGSIEVHRFNDGVRTQFYGPVAGCTTIFGGSIQTDAFKFNEDNDISLTTKTTEAGVHIKMSINGEQIVDFVDSYEGMITSPGYIGTASPNAPVVIK